LQTKTKKYTTTNPIKESIMVKIITTLKTSYLCTCLALLILPTAHADSWIFDVEKIPQSLHSITLSPELTASNTQDPFADNDFAPSTIESKKDTITNPLKSDNPLVNLATDVLAISYSDKNKGMKFKPILKKETLGIRFSANW
jgi:hypothetical protein